jgi:hypothetical protein
LIAALRTRRREVRRRQRRAAALVALFGLVAPLGGCGSFHMPFFGSKAAHEPVQACPVAAVLRPLASTAVFGVSADRRPINVAYYGILSDVSATCTMTGTTLHAALDIVVAAERAPASSGNGVDLNYFVAVAGANNQILSKNPMAIRVPVQAGVKRGGVTDHVEIAFDTGGRPTADLNIVVGFQQSPEAIEFYKNFRGR